ncbi:chromatin remodelling complex Rsc7/Swp82 subunit-domain-containing protein [Dipodascopsis tothii]|uniref:chromatin remodelling complex Rsc7/Swp82 subunit-domain-containing protein n=1 Tax=Dipodascopsis tothii TaxID=44089 RepID=UPI0034CE6604
MLSTEPARCTGFRDSYLFFHRHRRLLKIIVDDEQKFDLIKRNLIPHSYKGRAIGVVTARSVFKEFGSRIIVGGRRVIDDYYEEQARLDGAVEGELADPDDRLPPPGVEYNRNQYVAWHGASAVYHTTPAVQPTTVYREHMRKKRVIVTDENWMFEHARATSQFNTLLSQQRRKIAYEKGVYEPHTGVTMVPRALQPSLARWEIPAVAETQERLTPDDLLKLNKRAFVQAVMTVPAVERSGLRDIDEAVYKTAEYESDEVRHQVLAAIEHQKKLEEAYDAHWAGGEIEQGQRAVLKVNAM